MLEENAENIITSLYRHRWNLLERIQIAYKVTPRTDKLKSFQTAKGTIRRLKKQYTAERTISVKQTSGQELVSRMYEELWMLNTLWILNTFQSMHGVTN